MILDSQIPELRQFRRFEGRIQLEEDRSFGSLVIAGGNEALAVHRWFRYKESYSANLLYEVASLLASHLGRSFSLLDPFCGMGTSILSAQMLAACGYNIDAVGIEQNPFAAWAAQTKLNWHRVDTGLTGELLKCLRAPFRGVDLPVLSSISEGRCISRYMAKKIVAARNSISTRFSGATRDAMLLALAASIEPVSKVRKDGRALRIVKKNTPKFESIVLERWKAIKEDVDKLKTSESRILSGKQHVITGDGRTPTRTGVARNSVDLILTSPPYPNNIDYSEVYKLELWLLGFISDSNAFLNLRKSTFRSHPTCESVAPLPAAFLEAGEREDWGRILAALVRRSNAAGQGWRSRMIRGYFADLWTSLMEHFAVLKPGGFDVIVIGNSLHGSAEAPCLIPTDLVVTMMAMTLGFDLPRLVVARPLKRRLSGNHFLRESVIVLRKPHGN
jgi:hypothetical protein